MVVCVLVCYCYLYMVSTCLYRFIYITQKSEDWYITNWYPVLKRHRDQLLATGPIRYMRTPCICPHVSCTTPLRHIIAYTINWEIILRLSCGGLGQSVHSRSQPMHSRSQPMHSHKDVLCTCSLFTFHMKLNKRSFVCLLANPL